MKDEKQDKRKLCIAATVSKKIIFSIDRVLFYGKIILLWVIFRKDGAIWIEKKFSK